MYSPKELLQQCDVRSVALDLLVCSYGQNTIN